VLEGGGSVSLTTEQNFAIMRTVFIQMDALLTLTITLFPEDFIHKMGPEPNFCGAVTLLVAVWLSGNIVGASTKSRRAGLVQRWVTVCGCTVLVFNQATQVNSAWPLLRG